MDMQWVLHRAALGVFAISAVQACSNSSSGGQGSAPAAEVASYQGLSSEVQSAIADYQTMMTAPGASSATCASLHARYDSQVRPWISQMVQMAGSMDGFMRNYQGGTVADNNCVAVTMLDELDYHRSRACTFAEFSADQAETVRHVNVMTSYTQHVRARCDQMLSAFDGRMANWGPMMQGCQAWDGHCSGMMHDSCCQGMMMHDHCVIDGATAAPVAGAGL